MEFRRHFEKEFPACERLLAVAEGIEAANQDRHHYDPRHPSTAATAFLFAKAWKTFRALLLLATNGYGKDAMILARSLAGLCIDLAYIVQKDSDARTKAWAAVGRVSGRRMANTFGKKFPGEDKIDWKEQKRLAASWKRAGAIEARARATDNVNLYEIAYRHGSSYEHSDAWSSLSYLKTRPDQIELRIDPSDALVWNALILGAFTFPQIIAHWAAFFRMDLGTAGEEMRVAIKSGFGVDIPVA